VTDDAPSSDASVSEPPITIISYLATSSEMSETAMVDAAIASAAHGADGILLVTEAEDAARLVLVVSAAARVPVYLSASELGSVAVAQLQDESGPDLVGSLASAVAEGAHVAVVADVLTARRCVDVLSAIRSASA